MDWCRLTSDYYQDAGIVRAGEAAEVLFLRVLAYCASQENGGRFPRAAVAMLAPTKTASRLQALIREKLLVEEGDDLLVRSWDHHQRALDAESERRRKAREKKARQRARDTAGDKALPVPGTVPGTDGGTSPVGPRHIEVEVEEERTRTSAKADAPPRTDVERMCRYFLTGLSNNGVKATITERWRTEARLMLDKDARDPLEIKAVMDFALADPFWKANVHGVPKLREQFDKLRLGMQARTGQTRRELAPKDAWLENM